VDEYYGRVRVMFKTSSFRRQKTPKKLLVATTRGITERKLTRNGSAAADFRVHDDRCHRRARTFGPE